MNAPLWVSLAGSILLLQACTQPSLPKPAPELRPSTEPSSPPSLKGQEAEASDGNAEGKAVPLKQASGRVMVGQTWLELRDCELAYGAGEESRVVPTQLPPPCQFAKSQDGSIRIVESPKGSVLVVESSRKAVPPSPSGPTIDCDTRLRGIIVAGQKIHLSRDTQRIAHCAPGLWDEKMFLVFALHPIEP